MKRARVPSDVVRLLRLTPGCIALIVAAFFLRLTLRLWFLPTFVDDAFIFLRYARNFGDGQGLVYNAGDAVYGYSSPLYVVMLGALATAIGSAGLEVATLVLDLGLWLIGAVLAIDLARRNHPVPLLFVVPALFWFPIVSGSLTGMETMLFIALLLATIACLHRERYGEAAVTLALLLLTRPEGVVVLIATLIWAVLRRPRPRPPLRWSLAAGGLLLAWGGFAAFYYGSAVPQSLLSKAGGVQGHLAGSASGPLQDLAILAFGISSRQFAGLPDGVELAAIVAAVGLVALVALDAYRQLRASAPAALLPLTFFGTWVMYVIGDPVHIWSWYTVPTTLCFWWSVTRQVARASIGRRTAERGAITAVAALCLVSIIVGVPRREKGDETVRALEDVSRQLAANSREVRSIMIGDVGVVGYRSDARIIDLSGLVSTEALANDPFGVEYIISTGALVRAEAPDAVVTTLDLLEASSSVEGTILRGTFTSVDDYAYFRDTYVLLPRDDDGRFVYVRRDLLGDQPSGSPSPSSDDSP